MMKILRWLGISVLVLGGAAHAANRQTLTQEAIFGQIATPSNPAAGKTKLYSKSGSALYFLNSGGTEKTIADLTSTVAAATSCTNTTNVATTSVSTNATYYLPFVALNSTVNQGMSTGSGITFNPSTNNLSTTTFTGALAGNATTATSATSATNATNGATVSTSSNASFFPLFAASSSNGNQPFNLGTGLTFNPSTNNLSTTTFTGALAGNATTATSATSATNATNVGVTDDTTTNATMYPAWFTTTTGNLPHKVSSTKLTFNPSTGALTAGQVIDSGLTADTVPYADGSKQLTSSSVTSTELGYLSGATSNIQTQINSVSAGTAVPTSPDDLKNIGISTSVSSNALTIALKQSDGSTNCSTGTAACVISMRNSTATTGGYLQRSVTSALSIVVPAGASMGLISNMPQYLWVYALDTVAGVELAVSGVSVFPNHSLYTTTAIAVSGGSTFGNRIYSTTARTNVPIRLISRLLSIQVNSSSYATAPTEVAVAPIPRVNHTDWATASFITPDSAAFGTVTANTFDYKREGDRMCVRGSFKCGTNAANTARVALTGYQIDFTKFTGRLANNKLGMFETAASTGAQYFSASNISGLLFFDGSDLSNVYFSWRANGDSVTFGKDTASGFISGAPTMVLDFCVPILGWSTYGF